MNAPTANAAYALDAKNYIQQNADAQPAMKPNSGISPEAPQHPPPYSTAQCRMCGCRDDDNNTVHWCTDCNQGKCINCETGKEWTVYSRYAQCIDCRQIWNRHTLDSEQKKSIPNKKRTAATRRSIRDGPITRCLNRIQTSRIIGQIQAAKQRKEAKENRIRADEALRLRIA